MAERLDRRVGLVTGAAWPQLDADDQLLQRALVRRGVEAVPVIWTDPGWATRGWSALVLRSCWDYPERIGPFRRWLSEVERSRVPLWNPVETVRWNLDKRYLMQLEGDGVPIVPTVYLDAGQGVNLPALLRDQGWEEAVIKPSISCGALRTRRVRRGEAAGAALALRDILRQGAALVQCFLPELLSEGELSFVFIEGALSHAVRLRPRPGDFRVQPTYGGTVERLTSPSPDLVQQARAVLRAATEWVDPPLYARVDGVVQQGQLLLMELELIEPRLYLRTDARAADRLADALLDRLGCGPRSRGTR